MENIEHLMTIKTAPSKVYEVLTTEKGLGEIWTKTLTVKPELGFINEFAFGAAVDKMKIVELVENKRIAWDVLESDPEWVGTTITFDLEDKNGNTIITLKQLNWRAVTDLFRACSYNWAFFLYSLKLYCEEGKGIPYQSRKF